METKIGTWFNGKSVYKKVIIVSNINGGNSRQYAYTDVDISELNVDVVVKFKSVIYNDIGYFLEGNAWYTNTELSIGTLIIERNTLRIRTNQEWAEGYTAYVTLYYTKTTD